MQKGIVAIVIVVGAVTIAVGVVGAVVVGLATFASETTTLYNWVLFAFLRGFRVCQILRLV